MKERDCSVNLMEAMKAAFRGAVIVKYNDRSTKFHPDIGMFYLDRATCLEVKHLKPGESLATAKNRKRLMGQLVLLHQIATHCGGRGWVVVYEDSPRRLTIWRPQVLASSLWPGVIGLPPIEPYVIPESSDLMERQNLFTVMASVGAVRVNNWPHQAVVKLIREAMARA